MNNVGLLLVIVKGRVDGILDICNQLIARITFRKDIAVPIVPMSFGDVAAVDRILANDESYISHCVITSISPPCCFLLITVATCSACFRSLQTIANSPRPCLPFQTIHLWPRPLARRTFPRFFGILYVAITQAFAVAISS